MAVCPYCKTDQTKRKGDACPNCGGEVEIYKGFWFRSGLGSPTVAILERFEDLVSRRLGEGRQLKVSFSIPRKGLRYKRELVVAERLLVSAGYDFDLVLACLEILFTDKEFSWKARDTLLYIETDFNTALAIARAIRSKEEANRLIEQRALESILNQEDIFNQ
jgi:hypothetical protein